jgi:hypothetical protein
MRRPMLLAALLAVPGLALAQVPETQTKSQSKTKPSAAPIEEEPGSALDKTRAKQGGANEPASVSDQGPADQNAPDAAAPDKAPSDAAAAPDEPDRPLSAKLFVTHDPAGFAKAWKAGETPLPTTGDITQTSPVMAMVAVGGCTRGKDGKCTIQFTSRTAGPDGLFDKPTTSPPWKPAPIHGKPELAPASFGLRLGPGDPPGRYTIEVAVSDAVAKTRRVLTATVTKPAAAQGR